MEQLLLLLPNQEFTLVEIWNLEYNQSVAFCFGFVSSVTNQEITLVDVKSLETINWLPSVEQPLLLILNHDFTLEEV